jgi:phenylacetyl-CoA:acceptor oxidoreductase subunit 1
MTRWSIVADLNRCVGCQTCTAACKHANATAPGVQWRSVLDFETGEYPDVNRAFLPVGCMHCDTPSCMEVCPSTATGQRDDGIVTIDYDICIGCAYCAVACPYQARFRVDQPSAAFGGKAMLHETMREDPARLGVAQKCTLCVDLVDNGLAKGLVPGVDMGATPACVASCIAGALHMGDLDDPDSNVSQLLREQQHFRMHEELGNGPGIVYLYDRQIGDMAPVDPPPMAAEPAGLAAVSPKLQTSWDWRAAANFTYGGSGSGLFAMAMLAGLVSPVIWVAIFTALAMIGAGLLSVWMEIGRRWRFLNVFRNPNTSWMTREALMAVPLFGFGGLAWLTGSAILGWLAAPFAVLFLYCQARILRAAKGIPTWRQPGIVALIMSTGLTEGAGLLSIAIVASTASTAALAGMALAALTAVRLLFWKRYRSSLGSDGAPAQVFSVLDGPQAGMAVTLQAAIIALAGYAATGLPGQGLALVLAALTATASGWALKYALITKAAYNQGFAINRMPARGAGKSAPGIKPGWTRA